MPGAHGRTHRRGRPSPTPATAPSRSSSALAAFTRCSLRTSTACIRPPAHPPSSSSRSTARSARSPASTAGSAHPWSTPSRGSQRARTTRPVAAAAASSSRRRSASARTSSPPISHAAEQAARAADLLLAVGSTLSVYPIAEVVPVAKMHGAAVVIVNGSKTAMDDLADVVLRGPLSELLPALVEGIPRLV